MPVPGSIKSRRWCRVCFVVFALLLADGPSIGGEMDIATRPLRRFPEQGVSGAGLRGLGYWRAREVLVALQADGPSDEEWSSSTILEIEPGGMLAGAVRVAGRFGTCCLAVDEDAERILLLDEESREVVALGLDGNSKGVSAVPVPIGRLPAEVVTPGSMAWDPISEELLVLDLSARRVMRLTGVAAHGARRRGRSLNAARDFTVDLGPLGIDDPQGLAVEPASGHLFVLSPSQRKVFELSSRGEMLAGYDLGAAGVAAPRGIVLAPSSDRTDDPSRASLFVAEGDGSPESSSSSPLDAAPGRIVELAVGPPTLAQGAQAATGPGSLVNAVETSQFTPPSPDPTGLAYRPDTGTLLISDSEVDEMAVFSGVNVWETTLQCSQTEEGSTTSFSIEPTGVAVDPVSGHWFFSDDDARRVFEVDAGPDGRPLTSDDTVTSFQTNLFGSTDPEGVAFDAIEGRLFISDGVNAEIYEVRRGANGFFDGVPPVGDDVVSHFDTERLGLFDTEGLEFNPDAGTLFIVSRSDDIIAETSTSGALVRTIDTSALHIRAASGIAYAPGSQDPTVKHLYIADRGMDNLEDPNENDGKIFEITAADEPRTEDVRVAASADDAEEKVSGTVLLRSPDLEMTFDGVDQTVGIRFDGVRLARGAAVVEAWLQFKANEGSAEPTSLLIRGQADDDAPPFAAVAANISSRPVTAASAAWSPPPWLRAGDSGMAQRSPDLSHVVREIVHRSGWRSGSAIVLIVTGTGRRVAKAWDLSPSGSALLHLRIAASCGDGVKGPGEECDGADLGGATCSEGGCGGTPRCSTTCVLDFSSCTVGPEVCDGLDNDCDGTVDNPPPPASPPELFLSPAGASTSLSWAALSDATHYDVVRGSVTTLRSTSGDFEQATGVCLADDLAQESVRDGARPATGDGFWYLVRAANCGGQASYDDVSPYQHAPRDPGIGQSIFSCP